MYSQNVSNVMFLAQGFSRQDANAKSMFSIK